MSTPQLTANEHTGLKARTGEVESLVSRIAVEMADSWRKGERPRTEDYLDRYPELWERPSAALELIAEELAVREEYGEPISPSMLARRFPRWRDQVRALGDCHREMGGRPGISRFPEAGTTLGDFRLGFELGRGASGRVFAATQSSLGSRPVVLKLSSPAGNEHLSLARLQHTHIVPIHSVHEFPDRGLIALCMPYFGGATLATVLAALADRPVPTRTGADLVTTLRGLQARSPLPIPVQGPGCDSLAASSYTHAICRIGVCLARALQFAHDRGLLHLDIKPSNVLIAADGVPMLLYFHLARPPLRVGDLAPTMLGGTPGYMAPEHAL
ncbi:MAG TPA: phosphotransferase, partial [Gemmata sp.]|nr:phosphotransferase [Gemmata sp.]